MIPVVTPEEMRAIDAAAPEPIEVLIERAGAAVAREALRMLGGGYGRTVHVVAGKGNNGADGIAAARRLERRGVRCRVHDAADPPPVLPPADLVVDAAYGTGFRGEWSPPAVGATPVLAVDVVSGLDALTGAVSGRVVRAERTITFQAMKPGHLLGAGPELSGEVVVADIGLDVSSAQRHLVTADACAARWPRRRTDDHKWGSAVRLVAGSAEMPGAAVLAASAAARAGAGLVSLAVPGTRVDDGVGRPPNGVAAPAEIVQRFLPSVDFAASALDDVDRFGALVVGPGLGRGASVLDAARQVVADAPVPVVIDGDGIAAVAESEGGPAALLADRASSSVLTPHDGEFERLTGHRPGPDRPAEVVEVAARLGATVLLKGPTTVVASPDGRVRFVDHGDERLATAGTGDVLSGIVAALLAHGTDPLDSAAVGAWVHADAGRVAGAAGLVAGDLVRALPAVIGRLGHASATGRVAW